MLWQGTAQHRVEYDNGNFARLSQASFVRAEIDTEEDDGKIETKNGIEIQRGSSLKQVFGIKFSSEL